jgi:hypothetical protein
MNDVNLELGRASGGTISLNDSDVRQLAGVPSGTISMDDLRGKSAGPPDPTFSLPLGFSFQQFASLGGNSSIGRRIAVSILTPERQWQRLTQTVTNGSPGAVSTFNVNQQTSPTNLYPWPGQHQFRFRWNDVQTWFSFAQLGNTNIPGGLTWPSRGFSGPWFSATGNSLGLLCHLDNFGAAGIPFNARVGNVIWVQFRTRINTSSSFVTSQEFAHFFNWQYIQSSDRRLKTHVLPMGVHVATGLTLYEFSYVWDATRRYVGVMAQDVQKIMPQAVLVDSDGYLCVDYSQVGFPMMSTN